MFHIKLFSGLKRLAGILIFLQNPEFVKTGISMKDRKRCARLGQNFETRI